MPSRPSSTATSPKTWLDSAARGPHFMLALAGWGNVLYADAPQESGTSARRLVLGIATLAAGAIWLWLVIQPL